MPIVRNGTRASDRDSGVAYDRGNGSQRPAGQRGKAAAAVAGEQGQQMADEVKGQGQHVATMAGDQAREVVDLVREQASQLTGELTSQGRGLYDETRQQVAQQAETQTQELARTLHRWASETQALADGRPADAGAVGMYARQCADRLYQAASDIEIRGASGLLEEVQDLAKRRPAAFLVGAAIVGFGGGRLLRSGASGGGGASQGRSEEYVQATAVESGSRAGSGTRRRQPVGAGAGGRHNPPSLGGE